MALPCPSAPPGAPQPSPAGQRSRGAAPMPPRPLLPGRLCLRQTLRLRAERLEQEERPRRGDRGGRCVCRLPAAPSPCRGAQLGKAFREVPLSDALPSLPRPHQGSSLLGPVCPRRPQTCLRCGAPSVLGPVGTGAPPPAGADTGQRQSHSTIKSERPCGRRHGRGGWQPNHGARGLAVEA